MKAFKSRVIKGQSNLNLSLPS